MSDSETQSYRDEETDTALLEAELFIKYQVPHRAIERLRTAIEQKPQSILLRERLCDVAAANNQSDEAARQCLALANLYIAHDDFDCAQERLLEAKQLDARISITSGLEAIRRARRDARTYRAEQGSGATERAASDPSPQSESPTSNAPTPTLAGDLAAVSIFDAVQVIENSRLTGTLVITTSDTGEGDGKDARTVRGKRRQYVRFNEGQIVGAEIADASGADAFRRIIETTEGAFKFERSAIAYPVTIHASSNTNLLLDSLRQFDEEKA